MKTKLWILGLIAVGVIFACNKDLYTTAPTLKFESVNSTQIQSGSYMIFKIQATDKEGDIQDTMWVQKVSYDSGFCGNVLDSFVMPSFSGTKDLKATINVQYAYNFIDQTYPEWTGCTNGNTGINDSCYFRFWIHDNAQHTSDTVRSPDIILIGQ